MNQKLIGLFISCTVFFLATETVASAPSAVSDNINSEIRTQKNLVDSVFTYRLIDEVDIVRKDYYSYHDDGQVSSRKEVYPSGTYVIDLEGYSHSDLYTELEYAYDTQGNLVSRIMKTKWSDKHWLEEEVELYFYNEKKLLDSAKRTDVCGLSYSSSDGFEIRAYCMSKHEYIYNEKNQVILENTIRKRNEILQQYYIKHYAYNQDNQLTAICDSSFSELGIPGVIKETYITYSDTLEDKMEKIITKKRYLNDKLVSSKQITSEYRFNENRILISLTEEVIDTNFNTMADTIRRIEHYKVKLEKEYNPRNQITSNKLFYWNESAEAWDLCIDEQTQYNEYGNILKTERYEFDDYNDIWICTIMSEYYSSMHDVISGNEPLLTETFQIYPNPASHHLIIRHNHLINLDFVIIDMNGRVLLSGKLNNETINISSLKQGMYIIRLFNKNTMMQQKFIKSSE